MSRRKSICLALLCAALALLCSGCFMRSPDELLTLPQQAEDYYNLQQAIDTAMHDATYCAPTGGDNRQPVQMKDLNGDGVNEAIAFAKAEGELPLKIYVFRRNGALFSQVACLEGDGAGFDTVQFSQLDGKDGLEMVVTRQLSEGVPQMVSVYVWSGDTMGEAFSGSFRQFQLLDVDGDECDELFVLSDDAASREALALIYKWQNGQMTAIGAAPASTSAESLVRLQTGKTSDGVAALFCSQAVDEAQMVTDVFVWSGDALRNVTRQSPEDAPVPYPAILAPTDVDGSGATRLPRVDEGASGEDCLLVEWYAVTSDGTGADSFYACHHADGAWYLLLNDNWLNHLRMECITGEDYHLTTLICLTDEGKEEEICTICAYFGADGEQWAVENGYFTLGSRTGATYCARLGPVARADGVSQQTLRFYLQRQAAE